MYYMCYTNRTKLKARKSCLRLPLLQCYAIYKHTLREKMIQKLPFTLTGVGVYLI